MNPEYVMTDQELAQVRGGSSGGPAARGALQALKLIGTGAVLQVGTRLTEKMLDLGWKACCERGADPSGRTTRPRWCGEPRSGGAVG